MQVVAYAILTSSQLSVQLTKLGVHPNFRRKGVARSLLQVHFLLLVEQVHKNSMFAPYQAQKSAICRLPYQLPNRSAGVYSVQAFMSTAAMLLL